MAQTINKILLSFLTAILLTGCVTKPSNNEVILTHDAQTRFNATGKLGIRSTDLAESARFMWSQDNAQYTVELVDPFGRQVMQLSGDQYIALLKFKDEHYRATSPEELMERLLGWTLPVSHALYWIQGHPDPDSLFNKISNDQFEQAGWLISILGSTTLNNGETAPRKLKLQNRDLTLTLIVSKWEFPQ